MQQLLEQLTVEEREELEKRMAATPSPTANPPAATDAEQDDPPAVES